MLHSCSAGCMECYVKSFSHGSHNETCNDAKDINLLIALVLTTKKHITTYTLTIKQKQKKTTPATRTIDRTNLVCLLQVPARKWSGICSYRPGHHMGVHPVNNMAQKNQQVCFIQYTFNTTLHSQNHFSFINVKSCTSVTLSPPHC